jgi:limonene-1,2-epoxide hydrolase
MDPITWVNVGIGVARGVASAIEVFRKLNAGESVTEEEVRGAAAESKSLHDQVQNA